MVGDSSSEYYITNLRCFRNYLRSIMSRSEFEKLDVLSKIKHTLGPGKVFQPSRLSLALQCEYQDKVWQQIQPILSQ